MTTLDSDSVSTIDLKAFHSSSPIDYISIYLYNAGNKCILERRIQRVRYTREQKAEALKSIDEIGVAKTVEALKISAQTLYKWRNKAKTTQSPETEATRVGEVFDAQGLLDNDRLMQEKIVQLEAENRALRATIAKYRAALSAVLEVRNE